GRDVARCNLALLDQQLFKRLRRKRLAKQKSLHHVTLERGQILKLFLRLDTLGNHRQIERVAQVDDRAYDRRVVRILADVGDERLINLQRVDRKPLQIIERRVTRAEVVDRDADSHQLQLVQFLNRLLRIFHDRALG